VLIPAVENSVSGDAMRPLDVLHSRKGITVEVGDTDAEGRLILADALAEADSESPDLIIDAATLTGAARVAVGTGMPAVFSRLDSTWQALESASDECADPMWRLPLFSGYRNKLNSKIADISNMGNDAYAGAIVAALFLAEFVDKNRDWVHMDTMGYNLESRPGRPSGGETLGLLTLHAMLEARYGQANPNHPTISSQAAAPDPTPTAANAPSDTKKRKKSSPKKKKSTKKRSAK
jgi:leucyl aminopeptidase